ncbi:RagB/SusD family nutrient uptake outer membrane protein [Hymenobacter cellulosilyticus]|uniref:RagB/SusD family nutrient uptake outer membrane protein n=1 Tax=Hymenobacter cellulosilyticus TaxID=2932248 RepID=A0A8T9QEB7_9BACT|nr:RagB/SusD family nutrient uptake outer membrane protein [Hymenobacter cellulosilyticus]UOQ74180.1 RagB/SusD family nutrient uptake outer membrane protein [Hymenobacter cellulosilyticus]
MKRIFRSTMAALGIVCLSGLMTACKDFLEVEPTAIDTSEAVFSTVSGAYSAVIGAYAPMAGDAAYGNRISCYFPYDSEDFLNVPTGDDAGEGRRGIARYNSNVTNADVRNAWNALYKGIERANICIKYIPTMAQYNGGADQKVIQRLHGEALTLRAQYYFELIRNWGDVPAPYEPTVTGQDFNIPRTDRNEILDKMLADLELAATLVPWRTEVAADERITKGAVKALRARLALYRAGYYTSSKTGAAERASDYKQFYDIVRQECAELMAKRGEHDLNPNFEEPFRSIAELRRDAKREIMFEVAMGGTVNGSTTDSKLGYYNGPRITAASANLGLSSGAIVLQPTYFYAFDSTDTRRDVTIAPYTINAIPAKIPTNMITAYDGKFRREWSTNPTIRSGSAQALGYNWPLIRFSDVLLMFAEAENEATGSPTPAARAALKEVRDRAYRNATAPAVPTGYSEFQAAVMKERHLEFGGEGMRKYDLIRWNKLGSTFQEIKTTLRGWIADQTGGGQYANIPLNIFYNLRPATGTPPISNYVLARSLYRPSPSVDTPPANTTAVAWRRSVTEARIADIASGYQPARQLLPIPAEARNTNNQLTQNVSY